MNNGACEICGMLSQQYECAKCRKKVCKNHYIHGFCSDCAKKNNYRENNLVVPDSAKPTKITPGDVKK